MARILIIDDDADFRTVLQRELTDEGYTVAAAANGVDGFQAALDMPLDLILLDWTMPVRAGLETLRLIRSVQPDVKILIVTALIDEPGRRAARQLGVGTIVFKPIRIKELLATMQAILEGQAV